VGDILGNSCGGDSVGECSYPGAPGCTCGTIPRGMPACSGHGTHCAGTVGGTTVGVAKESTLVAVRVLNCEGSGSNSGVVAGMDYVVRMKNEKHPSTPTVMSMSLGGPRPSESYSDPSLDPKWHAVKAAKAAGVTVVVAAGNSGVDVATRSPAHIDDAITVCATNANKDRSYFSCFGPGVDVCAPGYQINSAVTGSDSDYKEYSGTSMATPHVAGVLALMLQHNADWTVEQQKAELLSDCVETGSVNLLTDSLYLSGRQYCSPGTRDDRCGIDHNPNNCHGCTNKDKCWSKNNYKPGSGEGETPCGWYSQSGECDGTCICYCGGKHCDATYLWGIWLDFCCSTYFAGCEPEVVTATPNRLTNLFGSGRCAAALPSGTNPSPVIPTPSPTPWTPPSPNPTPAPTPAPAPSNCRPGCSKSYCSLDSCAGCSFCTEPTPAPTPMPSPSPGTCHNLCDRPSDCTNYPNICSGCSFC